MARFKCIASGCNVISDRRRAPATCLDRNRCQFEEVETVDLPAVPVEPGREQRLPNLTLRMLGQDYVIHAPTVLGRNGDVAVDAFRADVAVSRKHCSLEPTGKEWTLTALSTSSPTILDGTPLPPDQRVLLRGPQHQLSLGTDFRVDIHLQVETVEDTNSDFAGELDDYFKTE